MDWDQYFLMLTYGVAMKSKDRNTNIGAVIVGPDNEVRSVGYNSFPRGLDDSKDERQVRPEKYFWFEHGERNAIYNAARVGTPINGCKMYTPGIPCSDCARGVIQSGIVEVIVHKEWGQGSKATIWSESSIRSKVMFEECGVIIRVWSGIIPHITTKRDGEFYNVF